MSAGTFSDLLSDEPEWPKLGDQLFHPEHALVGAALPRELRERLYHLTHGYKLAGDILVTSALTESWLRNKLVFPIVFSYRHFIELSLKSMLENYGHLANLKPNRSTHPLGTLWADFKSLLQKFEDGNAEDEGTQAVEDCIIEFSKVDPQSTSFRYPSDQKGQPFEDQPEAINLEKLRDTISAIETYFMATDA